MKTQYPIKLKAILGVNAAGYNPRYMTTLSVHQTVAQALRWGAASSVSAWTGPRAEQAGYPPEGRLSQLWIEADGYPATLSRP